jgi:hypothetical protein
LSFQDSDQFADRFSNPTGGIMPHYELRLF